MPRLRDLKRKPPRPEPLSLEDQLFLMKFEILTLRFRNRQLKKRVDEFHELTQAGVGGCIISP